MSTKHDDNFNKAVEALASGVVVSLVEVARLKAERDRYPDMPFTPREEAAYQEDRGRVLTQIRVADAEASNALRVYQREALAEARALRAAAEAGRNPMDRVADELERQRLVASAASGESFVQQAKAALAAGQPRRADLLLAVAEDKGAKFVSETLVEVMAALDASDPKRAEAKALEDAVATNSREFVIGRSRMLTKYGVGTDAAGAIGTGAPGQTASSSLSAKLSAWAQSQATGQDYVEPEGALSGGATGEYVTSVLA